MTLNELSKEVGGYIEGKSFGNKEITNILFDSRKLNFTDGTVFFAFKSKKNDGSKYIQSLYDKGIRMFVVQSDTSLSFSRSSALKCENPLAALQILAQRHREKFCLPVCAVTGSNGKTVTKDWILSLIGQDRNVCANIKSYNSQIGVPYSVFNLRKDNELAVFEAGISRKGEMKALERIIRPDIGVFTNIGDAHQINFSSMGEKIDEKLILFSNCKQLIYHNSNPLLTKKIKEFALAHSVQLISWGNSPSDTYKATDLSAELNLPFTDKASIENALNAYVFCLTIGIDKENLKRRIPLLQQAEMRFEISEGINNSTIINDAYSNDYSSLEIALDNLNNLNGKEKLVILSDMQQSSKDKQSLYGRINSLLKNKGIKNIITIGKDFSLYTDMLEVENKKNYLTAGSFLAESKRSDYTDKTILVKGAREFHFENIVKHLSLLGHQSYMEINLTALEENVLHFRSYLSDGTLMVCMVKASAYGAGSKEVALHLEKNKLADYLAVAFADEGVQLRQSGIQLPIMVMTPEENCMEKIREYNLEPVVHSFEVLKRFVNTGCAIHLKLDTGMHRLGFSLEEIPHLAETLKSNPDLKVKSVFSHLYGADEESLDKYTLEQISLYDKMSSRITSVFPYKILRHICNSAGIVRFGQAHFDMVRLGIGMYGIGGNKKETEYLKPVMSLYTVITQVREIGEGEDVSYSRKFVSPKPMRLGVIPVGYADGLNRRLGNGNFSVYVNGKFAPTVGNICMDMCMIDITDIDAETGDRVEIFSAANPVNNISDALNTIPYEVFTSISQRIKRVYFRE
ncbi:MAG: bifunctional UDP-N-acetylmuramoyl-tripeptide:D-alanyl-D-alanine ligase/alanine racemase [Bacteroidales bacterium]|nr:bifunctional UDP-N-acetylmuramoyl-tripeptide:D-alanyl-D-alanine ligase/alanine racemase [Bacteroidales bacterium]